MDKDELLALFQKANANHTDLVDVVNSIKAAVEGNKGTKEEIEKLKTLLEDQTSKAAKWEQTVEDLKNEIADFEAKGAKPALAISLKEQAQLTAKAVKTGIGKFLKAGHAAKESGQKTQGSFKSYIETEVKALNLTNTGEGLESVDQVLSREIVERARELYPIVGDVRLRNMPRDLREEVLTSYPATQEGIENVAGVAISETDTPTYAEVKNRVAKINAKPRITDEAMYGSDLDLYGSLIMKLDEEVGRRLADQIYYGNGTGKAMRGILSSQRIDITNTTGESFKPTLAANPADARNVDFYPVLPTGVSGELGSDRLTSVDFLIDMKNTLPTAYLGRARWRFTRNTLGVIEKLRDADGNPIFKDSYQDGIVRVLGFPVTLDDNMPNIGVDKPFIIFGDMEQAFSISNGDIDKMLLDPYTKDGCTIVKLDKEFFEMVGKNDAIIIGVATTNSGA